MRSFYTFIYTTIFLVVFSCSNVIAQVDPFLGSWVGTISLPSQKLRLVFHITEHDGVLITKIDSPDQFSFGTPASKTTIEEGKINIEIVLLGANYIGQLHNQRLEGTFTQAGEEIALNLEKTTEKIEAPKRPQTPTLPYPYETKDVTIQTSDDKVKLAGTLTTPQGKGPFPAVILISGSGPQNRDSEILGHKLFHVIADYLTRNGIAVLRYDDRGTEKSTGNFSRATTMDFADDALSAFNFLAKQKKIDKSKIGIIGHSEGGLIAPIVASKSTEVDFLVLLAGTSVPGSEILVDQIIQVLKTEDISDLDKKKQIGLQELIVTFIKENATNTSLQALLAKQIEEYITINNINIPKTYSKSSYAKQTALSMTNPWMRQFITLDPKVYLEKITQPTLALFGENDIQVTPQLNMQRMKESLKNNYNAQVQLIEKMNHLFQTCDDGSPSEYGQIEETIAPKVLEIIAQFIKSVK